MIETTPGTLTTATLEGAPAGLGITARLIDGDEILDTVVTVTPKLDANGDPLNAYQGVFTAPDDLPVEVEWLQDGVPLDLSELVVYGGAGAPASVDDPYFSIAEARAFNNGALASEAKYPDAAIAETRALVESELEKRCGQAFVPRTATETIDATGSTDILLRWPRPLTIVSASLDGTALTPGDLSLYADGRVYNAGYWARGRSNLTITYTHGHEAVLPAAKRAALTWTKALLVVGPLDERTTTFATEDGNYTLATPGVRGSHTGIPVVDEFIDTYNLHVAVA